MKNIFLLNFLLLSLSIVNAQLYFDDNDECSNSAVYGGFGSACTIYAESTTVGATFNANTDLFSCDSSSLKSSVFFTFTAGVSEVEFNLLSGDNINVTVLNNFDKDDCNPANLELINNCFTGFSSNCNLSFQEPTQVLFTDLIPQTAYKLAIWTDETEQTDFSFCLTRAPAYECGDGRCYSLAENIENCPEDCDLTPENIVPPSNDECFNSINYSLFIRPKLGVCRINATTFGATYNRSTDLFSCDNDTLKSTVFYNFVTLMPNVEFNLLNGENINVSLLKYVENDCNPGTLES